MGLLLTEGGKEATPPNVFSGRVTRYVVFLGEAANKAAGQKIDSRRTSAVLSEHRAVTQTSRLLLSLTRTHAL